VSGAKGQLLGYVSTSYWHVGHSIIMDDNSFSILPEVIAILSDDPVVMIDCPVGYCPTDSKSIN
jgi:NCAIR mutase (PurE)-related protein